MRPISIHAVIGPWELAFALGDRDDAAEPEEELEPTSVASEDHQIGFGSSKFGAEMRWPI